jgi:hypothetical protein
MAPYERSYVEGLATENAALKARVEELEAFLKGTRDLLDEAVRQLNDKGVLIYHAERDLAEARKVIEKVESYPHVAACSSCDGELGWDYCDCQKGVAHRALAGSKQGEESPTNEGRENP